MATGCSSENTITGRTGRLSVEDTEVARLTQWAVNPTLATTAEWGDSDSNGYTNRAIGRRDGTFTAEGKYVNASDQYELFDLGEGGVEAVLWLAPTIYWYFPCCICTDFNMTIDVDTEDVIGWSASFGADGIFYAPGAWGGGAPATYPA